MSDNYPDNFFVDFFKYCDICKYRDADENDYPCDDCLGIPVRESTIVPEYYISKDEK